MFGTSKIDIIVVYDDHVIKNRVLHKPKIIMLKICYFVVSKSVGRRLNKVMQYFKYLRYLLKSPTFQSSQ